MNRTKYIAMTSPKGDALSIIAEVLRESSDGTHFWVINGQYEGFISASPAKGGYSLTVGAKVMIRRVVSFAGRESVSFRWCNVQVPISQIANHPDALLNSWVSFDLPDNARWIPYTDEAALFFHNVMNSIALLNKRIQTEFGNEGKLMKMLTSGAPMLPMLGA